MQILYRGFIIILFLSALALNLSAQIPNSPKTDSAIQKKDTIATARDSIKLYTVIKKLSSKRKFTSFVYKLIFRQEDTSKANKDTSQSVLSATYKQAEGLPINNIVITTCDPLGYNIVTGATYQNFLEKAVNKVHIQTLPVTIQNLLLFKPHQPFDSSRVKESERLIRLQIYTHDAVILPVITHGGDSVDIIIKELDNWTLIPSGSISPSDFKIGLNENDFIGLGHRFYNSYSNRFSGGLGNFDSRYLIPNFRNTYVSALLEYGINERNKFIKRLDIERPFYSLYAKWTGGISLSYQNQRDSILTSDTGSTGEYRHFIQDYWVGKTWQLFGDSLENTRDTNFTLATRVYKENYYERPLGSTDSLNKFVNEFYYLISAGISSRKYKKERYVFRFGITEFVPVGRIFELTGGYDNRNSLPRWYAGARISWGNFYKFGYMSPDLEYGTFFYNQGLSGQTISLGLNYFTGLLNLGKWKFRQFIKTHGVFGIDHFAYETVSINQGLGIAGFNSPTLFGNNKIVLSLQTQAYVPWGFLGFRFGPYLLLSFAMVGQNKHGLSDPELFSQLGFGILINNDFLVLNTFQVSIAFYPYIPGIGNNILKFDPYKTTDFGFNDFQEGKPHIISYK